MIRKIVEIILRLGVILVFFVLTSVARAGERRIEGGDVIYSATTEDWSEKEALHRAQMEVLKQVGAECGKIPNGFKFYSSKSDSMVRGYWAAVSGGLAIVDCEGARREKTSHPIYAKQLEKYLKKFDVPEKDQDVEAVKERVQDLVDKADANAAILDAINNKLDAIARQPLVYVPPPEPEQMKAKAPSSALGDARARCLQKKARLQFKAAEAANDSYGNQAEGDAYEYAEEARLLDCG